MKKVSKINKRTVNALFKRMHKHKDKHGALQSFAVMGSCVADSKVHIAKACYSPLCVSQHYAKGVRAGRIEQVNAIISIPNWGYQGTSHDDYPEEQRVYVDWLINKSCWASAFITKCPDDALERGVVVRTDVPSNYMQQAQLSYRMLWENPQVAIITAMLMERGVEPYWAFFTSYLVCKPESRGSDQWRFVPGGVHGHTGMCVSHGIPTMNNMRNEEWVMPTDNYIDMAGGYSYRGVNDLYQDNDAPEEYYRKVFTRKAMELGDIITEDRWGDGCSRRITLPELLDHAVLVINAIQEDLK